MMNQKEDRISIKLPSKIITKLGGALYGGFVPAICETISNSYDADATLVTIIVDQDKKEVCIEDNGIGMSWETLRDSFFEAGNNRRTDSNQGKTKKGRFVTGKKGLGKFALFGFCEELYIETSDGKNINAFSININRLEQWQGIEYPLDPEISSSQDGKSYTKVILKKLRKNYTGLSSVDGVARRVNYVFKNEDDEFLIKFYWVKERKEETLDKEKRWSIVRSDKGDDQRIIYDIPDSLSVNDEPNKIKLSQEEIDYIKEKDIKGFLVARKETTKKAEQKGVAIFCRGKICQDPSYFDIQQTNSFGYAHLYGELEMDFLDAENDKDYISTNRKEIEWDKDEVTKNLRDLINKILKRYGTAYDRDKKRLEEEEIKKELEKLKIDPKLLNRLDKEKQDSFKSMLKSIVGTLRKEANKNKETYDEQIKKYRNFLQELATQSILLNDGYVQNAIKQYPSIKDFYDEALQALASEDFETVIMKANAIRDGVREKFPNAYEVFKSAITEYTKSFGPNVKGALASLLRPLQDFSKEKKNPIEELRSNTKTAHNTQKNELLKDKYIAELVLNYVFMYAGFVLGNPELFSQSPDSLKVEQHSQSDEQ